MKIIEVKKEDIREELVDELMNRGDESNLDIENSVRDILTNVRKRGNEALYEYTERFDGVKLTQLRVTEEEIEEAYRAVGDEFIEILKEAAKNIRIYHEEEKETTWIKSFGDGIRLGQKITPIQRAGLYVPGGKAGYPSTVLMDSIPAFVAGVPSLAMVTPPSKDGSVDPYILASAKVAGITEIYKLGGAQAVAALAYGTETIRPVHKIVGPGNIYVATAKKQVFGKVDIDMIAGPSEIGILADDSSDPRIVAADLLSQAEHDEMAAPILVTDSMDLANKVAAEVETQIKALPRQDIMRASTQNFGRIFVTENKEDALAMMNLVAPEHLEILFEDPENYLDQIIHAGAIFLGAFTPEPLGDYFAGPNHTLPTSGTAKFSSPLGVYDFIKRSSILYYDKSALEKVRRQVQTFAEKEGLFAHSNAIKKRFE